MLNGPTEEVVVQVQLEENEQDNVDSHPHCHHQITRVGNLSRKLELEEGTSTELGSHAINGTNNELGSQDKRFSSNLTSLLIIIA